MKLYIVLLVFISFPTPCLADIPIFVGGKEKFSKLNDELSQANDDIERLERYIRYKENMYDEYLKQIIEFKNIESGEKYESVKFQELNSIYEDLKSGVKDYISINRYKRLEATDNVIGVVNSYENILEAQGDFIRYAGDTKKLRKLINGSKLLTQQIASAHEQLSVIRQKTIPSIERQFQESSSGIFQAIRESLGKVAELQQKCNSYYSTKTTKYLQCERSSYQTCSSDSNGNPINCITEYLCDCYEKVTFCEAVSPSRACKKCPSVRKFDQYPMGETCPTY